MDGSARPEVVPARADPACAADLFVLMWDTMVDVLGSAATATLLRRSIRRASARHAEVGGLVVSRDGFDYAYEVPASWSQPRPEAIAAVRAIAAELRPLLVELTGPVILRRLSGIPALRTNDIFQEGAG